jgi:hypothetical protein
MNSKLKELKIEEFVWILYIGIIILSFYSNYLERKYILYKIEDAKVNYEYIMIVIFVILTIVYLYFLKSSINDVRNLKSYDSEKKKMLVYLSFIASFFIAVSGFIYLFIAIVDDNMDVELAFN